MATNTKSGKLTCCDDIKFTQDKVKWHPGDQGHNLSACIQDCKWNETRQKSRFDGLRRYMVMWPIWTNVMRIPRVREYMRSCWKIDLVLFKEDNKPTTFPSIQSRGLNCVNSISPGEKTEERPMVTKMSTKTLRAWYTVKWIYGGVKLWVIGGWERGCRSTNF